jgi:hypothetical protein
MTLAAAILFFAISSVASVDRWTVAQSTQSDSSSAAGRQPASQSQTAPEATKPSSNQTSGAQTAGSKPKTSAAKKTRHKKNVPSTPTCDPAPNATASGSGSETSSPQPSGAQAPPSQAAQRNCPPAKIVVPQGGISEQSIQLAGGSPGVDATQKRDKINQMLATTEENLKKVTGNQISSAEQTSVTQIRQFISQSKSAIAAGDLERAQTLAWKANLLSEDLVNPKQ